MMFYSTVLCNLSQVKSSNNFLRISGAPLRRRKTWQFSISFSYKGRRVLPAETLRIYRSLRCADIHSQSRIVKDYGEWEHFIRNNSSGFMFSGPVCLIDIRPFYHAACWNCTSITPIAVFFASMPYDSNFRLHFHRVTLWLCTCTL